MVAVLPAKACGVPPWPPFQNEASTCWGWLAAHSPSSPPHTAPTPWPLEHLGPVSGTSYTRECRADPEGRERRAFIKQVLCTRHWTRLLAIRLFNSHTTLRAGQGGGGGEVVSRFPRQTLPTGIAGVGAAQPCGAACPVHTRLVPPCPVPSPAASARTPGISAPRATPCAAAAAG